MSRKQTTCRTCEIGKQSQQSESTFHWACRTSYRVLFLPVLLGVQLPNENIGSKRQRVHVLWCHCIHNPSSHKPGAQCLSISWSLRRVREIKNQNGASEDMKLRFKIMNLCVPGWQVHPGASGADDSPWSGKKLHQVQRNYIEIFSFKMKFCVYNLDVPEPVRLVKLQPAAPARFWSCRKIRSFISNVHIDLD